MNSSGQIAIPTWVGAALLLTLLLVSNSVFAHSESQDAATAGQAPPLVIAQSIEALKFDSRSNQTLHECHNSGTCGSGTIDSSTTSVTARVYDLCVMPQLDIHSHCASPPTPPPD
jgi:hypothetical protein